jgi:voltage-gated potassium channel
VNGEGNGGGRSWFARPEPLRSARIHYSATAFGSVTPVRARLAFAGLSLAIVCGVGTGGYYFIGGGEWPLRDCFYMVLITITSVGYGEILPITPEGRLFTMGLLICGMGVSIYFLSALTAFIIEGDLREALWRRRMHRRLADLKDHFIVCEELLHANTAVVVIERDAERLEALARSFGERFVGVTGDATDDEVLRDAGVEQAKGLVAALQEDQDNLYVALSARQLNPKLRIVSRANADRAPSKLTAAGADAVVSPTTIGGRRMAHELLRPNVVGFLDIVARDVRKDLDIEEIPIPERSPLIGSTLATSNIRKKSSALVLAVMNAEGETSYNPPGSFRLEAGMTLIVLGEREQLDRLHAHLRGE